MSTMQSSPNFCLYSTAISKAVTTASGSSPLQWKMGMLKAFARSDEYSVLRPLRGSVVKPTCQTQTQTLLRHSPAQIRSAQPSTHAVRHTTPHYTTPARPDRQR